MKNFCVVIGNTLNNHQTMGSFRMLATRGLLLIFIALGTNGQLLTEKIPLGKVFDSLWKFVEMERQAKSEQKYSAPAGVMS